ncbi:MAG: hypothetical protein IPG89_14275 [Bacteroidetes bacterium]|nr:hypothetical protein [Bacteroidota bacterium]
MKTSFILTTLLVVAIQAMVNGQTQNNKPSSFTPTVKRGSLNIAKVSPNPEPVVTEKTEEAIKKITTINSKIEELNLQLVELQKMKIQVNDEIIAFFDAANNEKKQAIASSISLNIKREHLIKQAEEMLNQVEQLTTPSNQNSKVWMDEKIKKENIAYTLLIEASSLKATENANAFSENTKLIHEYMNAPLTGEKEYTQANSLQREAERHMRIAKQLRKEANELETLLLTYSALGNAEEQEDVALQNQQTAIKLFNNHICVVR